MDLENILGSGLRWVPLDNKGVSYIRLESEWNNRTTGRELEALKAWAVDRMLIFVDTLQPRIQELSRD
jgi:hypothetical protein